MKCNQWTLALAAAGVVSLGAVAAQADEAQHQVLTALSSTTLSGYVDTSAIWDIGSNSHNASYTGIPGRVFDGTADKLDSFNLDVVKISLEKPLDEGQWAAGYKTDLLFGPDANFYPSTLNGGNTVNNRDFAVKQAYVALRAPVGNGLDFKMGVFDTVVGYEVFESPNNPNFSRSFGYAIEPVNHTGLLASYHVADWLSISGGVADTAYSTLGSAPVNGSGHVNGAYAESQKTYMASAVLTAPDSLGFLGGSVLYAGFVDGQVFGRANGDNSQIVYVGGTIKTPLKGLSAGAAWDYRNDGPTFSGATENRVYALAGYLSYALTEKFRANARVDYLNGDNGIFYVDPNGNTSHLLATTLTLDYSLWDNVLTRAEFRWDHSLNGSTPYGNGDDRNAYTLTANIVYKF